MPAKKARELLDHISEGFAFVDRDFRVREMNAEGARIEGRPADELIGMSLWEAWPGLEGSELASLWLDAIARHEPVSLEHLYTWPDGRQAWLEMRAFPGEDGLAIFFRDISDKKRSEEELRRAEAELMLASRLSAMGTMAATLAHELAQPLTSVSNYVETCETLLRPLPGAEARKARRALAKAELAVDRAREILKRVRLFVAKGKIETAVSDLHSIVADAAILLLPLAQREGVEIDFKLSPKVRWVRVDAVQIQQVLVNLVRNAIEALAGAERRRIVIAAAPLSPAFAEVMVEDSGPGFAAERAERLFAPFHSSKAEGLGVGLSISRTIVEAHGGTIAAEPIAGGGARFRFTVPRSAGPKESQPD